MTNVVYDPVEAYLMGVKYCDRISLEDRLTILDMRLMVQGDELDSPTPTTMQDLARAIEDESITPEQISHALNILPLFTRKGGFSYGILRLSFEFYVRHAPSTSIGDLTDIDKVIHSGNYYWGIIISDYNRNARITDRLVEFEVEKRTVDNQERNTVAESIYYLRLFLGGGETDTGILREIIEHREKLIMMAKKYESKPVIDPIGFAQELMQTFPK